MDRREVGGARRRMRPGDLGAGSADGAAFDRTAALKEATRAKVCREDKAQLEALARFAFSSPGFDTITLARIGEDKTERQWFQVLYTPEGPVVRGLGTAAADPGPAPLRHELAGEPAPTGRVDENPLDTAVRAALEVEASPTLHGAAGHPSPTSTLGPLLADVATDTPDLVAVFAPISWQLRWANHALRDRLQVPGWATPPVVELLDEASQGHFVVKVLPDLLSVGAWHGRLTLTGPDVESIGVTASLVAHRTHSGDIDALVLTAHPFTSLPAPQLVGGPEEQFAALVEHVSDLIAVVEPAGRVRYASPATARLLLQEPGELNGVHFVDLLHPDDTVDSVAELVHIDDEGNGAPVSLRLLADDGTLRFIEGVVTDLTANPTIGGFVLNARDVTERTHGYELLSELAFTDPGTGLPNRLRILDRVTTMLEDAEGSGEVSLLLVDLDGFRLVNEAHGARAGDDVLTQVASRLVEGAGEGAVVARLRSDEFAIALPDVGDRGVATRAAESLRVQLAQPFDHDGVAVSITASVGVAVGGRDDQADELLRRADQACRQSRRAGGNRVELWSEEARKREVRRRDVEQQLRAVVDKESVRLHYQPVVSLREEAAPRLAGVEGLLRVHDDEGALLNPAEFVEAAESTGLLSRLGGQLLQTACEQLSQWDAQLRTRAPEHLSVNVAPRQLVDPGLATQVMAALETSGIEAQRLQLELTESTLIGQERLLGERIAFLRDLGVGVGLDEFGAGYSTLNYLKRFPLDFVKIDRSLVAGIGSDERDTAIVRSTVQLSHSLGLRVVAVGVESDEQLQVLRDLGCDEAQGYLFAAALEPDQLGKELANGLLLSRL